MMKPLIKPLIKQLTTLTLLSLPLMTSAAATATIEQSRQASEQWRKQHGLDIINDFRDLLALPNVANNIDDMHKNADWIEAYLAKRQFTTQRLVAGNAPYIFAERKTPNADKTILIYAHFDGQPVNESLWDTSPWQPTIRDNLTELGGKSLPWPKTTRDINPDWRIFGRSAGDDKAPVIALMAALDALEQAGIQPRVNIKLILDGEEERGSPTLDKIVSKYGKLLDTDLMLICDGPMHQSGKRQLVFGVRGARGLNLTTYGAQRPLHSGHYGNWSPNAAEQMAELLATLHHDDGTIAVKGIKDVIRPITKAERKAIDNLPVIDDMLKQNLTIADTRLKNTRIEEAIMQPAIVITGIQVGTTGKKARNVLLPKADASINFRLVPNQTVENLNQHMADHFKQLGYTLVADDPTPEQLTSHNKLLKMQWHKGGYRAFRSALDSDMALKLSDILTTLNGEAPLMTPTMGGSLPIYLFEEAIDAPIIILPVANFDNNQHGPNENLKIDNLWQAVDLYAAVLVGLD